jgi:hypothetical protein
MSQEAIQAVRYYSKLKGKLRDFLEAVAAFAEEGLSAEPSIGDLAGYLGVSGRTVRRLVGQVAATGELTVEYNEGRLTRSGKTNRYTLVLEGGTELAGVTEMSDICMYVDSISINREVNTSIQTPAKVVPPAKIVPPCDDKQEPPVNAVTVIKDLAEYGISGPHIWEAVKRALARSEGVDEIYDVLDYFDALRAKQPKKPLGAPWIAKQLAEIAASEEPRRWRWCDQLEPAKLDEFELIKRQYGGYMQGGSHANVS